MTYLDNTDFTAQETEFEEFLWGKDLDGGLAPIVGRAEPSQAEPSRAEPSQAKPSQAKRT
jgi:hypothetical protein